VNGIIKEEGYLDSSVAGGHAISIVGWKNIDGVEYIEFQNSWSENWGNNGLFYMTFNLFNQISGNIYYPSFPVEEDDVIVNNTKGDGARGLLMSILTFPIRVFNIILRRIMGK